MDDIKTLQNELEAFNQARDWDQFHTPANLAKSISIESGELLECFQWDEEHYDFEAVKEELADVFAYALQLATTLHLDVKAIIEEKMVKNGKKYPVKKAKGRADKYDKL